MLTDKNYPQNKNCNHVQLAQNTNRTNYMKLKQLTVGNVKTKCESKSAHSKNQLCFFLECGKKNNNVADQSNHWRRYPESVGYFSPYNRITVYGCVYVAGLETGLKIPFPKKKKC